MKIKQHWYFLFMVTILLQACNTNKQGASISEKESNSSVQNAELTTWEIPNSVRALEVIDENTIWYAGSNSTFGYTQNGGKTWQTDSLKIEGKNLEFRALAATEEAIFVMSIASPTYVFKSTDLGQTWEVVYQENDSTSFYNSLAFWNNKRGVATGDPIDGCLSVIETLDGGNTWEKIPCDKLPTTFEGEAEFAASNTNISMVENDIWIVTGGEKARVFHSPNFGETWEVIQTPIIEGGQMTGIYSVDFYDRSNGIIVGGDWNHKEMNKNNKAITKDGGQTWQLVAESKTPGYRSCVQYLNKEEILAVGSPGISYSSDGGLNWVDINKEGFYTLRVAPSGKVAWLAGNGKLGKLSW